MLESMIIIAYMLLSTTNLNDAKCSKMVKINFCGIFYSHLMLFQAQLHEPADKSKIERKIEWKMIVEMNAGLPRLQYYNQCYIQMNFHSSIMIAFKN